MRKHRKQGMATVLIIEDNQDIAMLYETVFAQHQVRIFNDVPEAIRFLRYAAAPDLVITDFYLPSGTGSEIASFIRSQQELHNVPILGVSVDDMQKDVAERVGMTGFLAKPIDISELINVAQRLISSPVEIQPPQRRQQLTTEMRRALIEYGQAYRHLYKREPDGELVDGEVFIGGQRCDIHWLRAETRRLNSLAHGTGAKNYLLRLIDKLRRL